MKNKIRNYSFACINPVSPSIKSALADIEIKAANENEAYLNAAKLVIKQTTFVHVADCAVFLRNSFYVY